MSRYDYPPPRKCILCGAPCWNKTCASCFKKGRRRSPSTLRCERRRKEKYNNIGDDND